MGRSHAVLERFDVYTADMAEATGDVVGGKPRSSAVLARLPMPQPRLCPFERTSVSAHPPALLATDDGVNGGGYPSVLMHLLVRGAF